MVLEYVKSKRVRNLAVPFERTTLPQLQKLKSYRFKLVDSMPAFVGAMAVKTENELSYIQKACKIAEQAYADILGKLKEGITENETAALLEYLMRKYRAEDRSFETIAAFGGNSSVPHHAPNDTKLRSGMPVLLISVAAIAGIVPISRERFYSEKAMERKTSFAEFTA